MKKLFIIAALAVAFTATPAIAQDAEVDRLLKQMLAKSQAELERSIQQHGDINNTVRKIQDIVKSTTKSTLIYRPYDVTQPRPPIGNFDALAGPNGQRPYCMPYWHGCMQLR